METPVILITILQLSFPSETVDICHDHQRLQLHNNRCNIQAYAVTRSQHNRYTFWENYVNKPIKSMD